MSSTPPAVAEDDAALRRTWKCKEHVDLGRTMPARVIVSTQLMPPVSIISTRTNANRTGSANAWRTPAKVMLAVEIW